MFIVSLSLSQIAMSILESKVHDLFAQAVEKPPSEWPSFLDQHCDSPELRDMVQRLLDLHVRPNDFLSKSAAATYPHLVSPYGERIEEFRIIRQIGKGGMGIVYLAEDTILKRPVALKIITHSPTDGDVVDRFRREARAAARLIFPGIVQIYRTGEEEGFSFIAMEFVHGVTLHERLEAQKQIPDLTCDPKRFRELGRLISEVADSLDFAHRASVIHRDVKPSNILIDETGRARLSDFGIARITTEQTLLQTGTIVGSCAYMSPEQARVRVGSVDHRTDIFSLGVVLYEAIGFRRPFDGLTFNDIFKALAEGRPTPVKKICPSVPLDLATICHKAMENELDHRYQTAAHMSADLRCFIEGRPILARPPGIARRVRIWAQTRHRFILVMCMLLLATALIGVSAALTLAQHATMGQLVVTDSHRDSKVTVARYADDLKIENSTYLGRAPISSYLQPGLYRVTIIDGGEPLEATSLIDAGMTDVIEMKKPSRDAIESLVLIPGGKYKLHALSSTVSHQEVNLLPFRISPTQVSNREYREYAVKSGDRRPSIWPDPYDPKIDELPVTDITWDEANRYCRWRGMRLPTPDEWQVASQGPNGSLFPWGNLYSPDIRREESETMDEVTYRRFARPVRSDPHLATPKGVMHMLSNVQEYTEGIAVDRNGGIILKGRSWADSPFRNPSDTLVLSGRAVRAVNRGFRMAISERKGR